MVIQIPENNWAQAKWTQIQNQSLLGQIRSDFLETGHQIYPAITLYGDLLARMMATFGRFTHRMEVYSVDEAFLDFSAVAPEALEAYALEIKQTVKQ